MNSPVDSDLLQDLRLDAEEQLPRCEQLLIELEQHADDSERLAELFRLLHSLKGNIGMVGLHALLPLPQAMEDILAALRSRQLRFDSLLGDILLLSFDRLRQHLQAVYAGALDYHPDTDCAQLAIALHELAGTATAQQATARQRLLLQLAPGSALQPNATSESAPDCARLLERYDIPADADVQFCLTLMQAIEQRSRYWQGRGLRLLHLTLAINQQGGRVVDPAQLAVATCLHDLGMAFLPLHVLHKESRLSREEVQHIRSHPRLGHDLLRRLERWEDAAEIVLHHQEHADGQGYPRGLREVEIHPGALILAIADTFDARTHERAHQTLSKRPRLRAILEINNLAGRQFSAHWVEVFNHTLQQQPQLAHL